MGWITGPAALSRLLLAAALVALAAVPSPAQDAITVSALVDGADRYDGEVVRVVGLVAAYRERFSRSGEPYTAFDLRDGKASVAVVRDLLVASAAALLVLLFVAWLDQLVQARARGRLASALAQRDQEIARLKGKSYDEVSQRLDALRQEISAQMAELRPVIEGGAPKGQA